jgi:hypothetical protein
VNKLDGAVVGTGRLVVNFQHKDPFIAHPDNAKSYIASPPAPPNYTLGSAVSRGNLFGFETHSSIQQTSRRASHQVSHSEPRTLPATAPLSRYATPRSSSEEWYRRASHSDPTTYTPAPVWTNQVKVTPGVQAHPHRPSHAPSPPQHIEAFGRRAQDPAVLQGVLNSMDITARVRSGQGLGPAYDHRDRQRIPEENRVIPERIMSGEPN